MTGGKAMVPATATSTSTSTSASARGAAAEGDETEILPRDLPPAAPRVVGGFIAALVVLAAVFAVAFRLPDTVSCTFVLVPESGADPVKAPRRGTVERVLAADGADVRAGEPLFVLRCEELRTLAAERATLEREVAAARERVKALEAEEAARAGLDRAAASELRAKVARLEREEEETKALEVAKAERHEVALAAARARHAAAEAEAVILAEREATVRALREGTERARRAGAISDDEVTKRRLEHTDATRDLGRATRAVGEAKEAIAVLEADRKLAEHERALAAARRAGEIAEAREAISRIEQDGGFRQAEIRSRMPEVAKQVETGEIRMASLARELEGAEGEDLPIVAPYDGTVIRLGPRRAGVVIERGEVLCELARAGGQLRAELAVPERDAGRLAPGQPVRLLLSSFPHTRYGARPGTLLWVSPAAAGTGPGTSNGATFRAIASLEDLEIVVAGERRPLRAGMGGEARIVTQNLTLLELAFEPMRALKENLGSSP